MSAPTRPCPQRGFSLIELVLAIVVISVGLAGILTVINQSTMHSADPMVLQQANAIAQSYMEEVLLHPYADPDDGSVCGTAEATRALFDDVCDYASLPDTLVRTPDGTAIAPLADYRVAVAVTGPAADLGPAGKQVNALKVTVTVTHTKLAYVNVTLTSYRAEYP